jgi:hypothetical protein
MEIRDMQRVTIIGVALCLFTGCTTTANFNEGGHPLPGDWLIAASGDSKNCLPIDGNYENLGMGRLSKEEPLIEMRLDIALGHFSSSNRIPKHVNISLNNDDSLLSYYLSHPDNRGFSISATCSNGRYVLKKELNNHYVGDGTTLDYSNRTIELGKSAEGDLIVHLWIETQFSSFGFLKSRTKREIWSRYKVVNSED